jgi:hypothetical protein
MRFDRLERFRILGFQTPAELTHTK